MFRCSVSNIAWSEREDALVYQKMKKYGFTGLEIAPTRVIPDGPYDQKEKAHEWSERRKKEDGLQVVSMQSIWYGHQEKIFGTKEERQVLIDYTKKAVNFAEAIGCGNLVFGNPRNRDTEDVASNYSTAIEFFREIGDYASEHNAVIAIEANPLIYNTHFLNTTEQAVEMAYKSGSQGVKVNIDLGTIIYNEESIDYLKQVPEFINHVHISEPGLVLIEKRELHYKLFEILNRIGYESFVSIEMGNKGDLDAVKGIVRYIRSITHETN